MPNGIPHRHLDGMDLGGERVEGLAVRGEGGTPVWSLEMPGPSSYLCVPRSHPCLGKSKPSARKGFIDWDFGSLPSHFSLLT